MAIHIEKSDRAKPFRARVKVPGMKRVSKSFEKKSDARIWAEAKQRELTVLALVPTLGYERHTVGEAIDLFIKTVLPTRAEESQKQTLNRLQEWQREIGDVRMEDLTGNKVHSVLAPQKNSGATKNRKRGTLSAVCTHFTKAPNQWLMRNPVQDCPRWQEPRKKNREMPQSDFEVIYAEAERRAEEASKTDFNLWNLPLILMLIFVTGIRRAELRRLKVTDLDWNDTSGLLRIEGKDTDADGNREIRFAYIDPDEYGDLLQRMRDIPRGENPYLFAGRNGKPCTISTALKAVKKAVGLEDAGTHWVRHTAISQMARKGFSNVDLQKFSGHKTLAMLDKYVHSDEDDIRRIMAQR